MNLYVVTGTTQGLGAALAERIARDPDNELIALARAPDGPIPGGARLEVDLANVHAVEQTCERIAQRIHGKRYAKAVLINNAGIIGPVGTLDALESVALERNLAVNLIAPMVLMGWFLRVTAEHAALRRIVNISSGAGRRPIHGWSVYCAAKAGLDMASRVAVLEAQATGSAVEIASLAPGVIDTGMQAAVRGASREQFADVERFRSMKEQGTLRSAGDVADEILRLEAAGKLASGPILDLRELAAG